MAVVVALAAALLCGGCGPRTAGEPPPHGLINLSPDGHGDYPSLAQAVRQAPEGATIVLAPGVYRVAAAARRLPVADAARSGAGPHDGHRHHGRPRARLQRQRFPDGRRRHVPPRQPGPWVGPGRCGALPRRQVELSRLPLRGRQLLGDERGRAARAAARHPAARRHAREPARLRVENNAHGGRGLRAARPPEDGAGASSAATAGPGSSCCPASPGPTDAAELARFLDPNMRGLMAGWHVPGAVVVVVKDGRSLLQNGYGLADVARREPVDPARTLFRIASVTKVFTATAVLQLAAQGRVKLGVDAQVYLPGVPLPATFSRPVTVADLLTHTSGFDERTIGMGAPSVATAPTLDEFLMPSMPSRVVPGRPVLQLLELQLRAGRGGRADGQRHAVRGLRDGRGSSCRSRMTRHDVRSPRGGHGHAGGSATATGAAATTSVPPDVFAAAAAGQLYSTGADMARFMLCELQGGQLDGTRILGAAWVRRMLTPRFDEAPQLPASGYAYVQQPIDNRLPMEQAGDWAGYASLLLLLPEDGLGIFVAANNDQGRCATSSSTASWRTTTRTATALRGRSRRRAWPPDLTQFAGDVPHLAHGAPVARQVAGVHARLGAGRSAPTRAASSPSTTRATCRYEPLVFARAVRRHLRGLPARSRGRCRLPAAGHGDLPAPSLVRDLHVPAATGHLLQLRPRHDRSSPGCSRRSGTTCAGACRCCAASGGGGLQATSSRVTAQGARAAAGLTALLDLGFLAGASLLLTADRLRDGVPPASSRCSSCRWCPPLSRRPAGAGRRRLGAALLGRVRAAPLLVRDARRRPLRLVPHVLEPARLQVLTRIDAAARAGDAPPRRRRDPAAHLRAGDAPSRRRREKRVGGGTRSERRRPRRSRRAARRLQPGGLTSSGRPPKLHRVERAHDAGGPAAADVPDVQEGKLHEFLPVLRPATTDAHHDDPVAIRSDVSKLEAGELPARRDTQREQFAGEVAGLPAAM